MSKQGKRKITVDIPIPKDITVRPSVFERLGTKKSSAKKTTEHCRQWVQNGSCAYGKSCKFASTHTLISPSKQRAANKDSEHKRAVKDDAKSRLHSAVVVRSGPSPDGEIDNWDQNDLEYADTDVLEKRRQQLQRELELQLKMDCGKDMRKDKKKPVSSTSSSRSSSSSSISTSSSDSSSSSSSGREARRKGKKGKLKRNSSPSSDGDVPSKKKFIKTDNLKRDKNDGKRSNIKKDERFLKKHDGNKKKVITKVPIVKKSLSPGKKSGGTPPIASKSVTKTTAKYGKSPQRRDRNRSTSPRSMRDRDKDNRDRIKDRDKERDKDREKERERTRARSKSSRRGRSRSPKPNMSHSKDIRKKESSERSRPVSPKKQTRRDGSAERHRKRSTSRDRERVRDHKDRSIERRKDKHDEKDRHDRKERGRDRNKDTKRDDTKRRGRDRGLGGRSGSDKGLEKPNKPMERLLPRPEERLAALAAISNRALETDKNSSTPKDRQDTHSERGGRKQDRLERDHSTKRERLDSIDRDQGDYERGVDGQYDNDRGMDHYDRGDDRYDDVPRDERSPGYMQGRDRHYDSGYDLPGPQRGYPEDDDRLYNEHIGDHRGVDIGYDDHRPRRDRSWEGRSGSMDRERGYMHPRKEWENEEYRPGEWGRERHWPMRDPQMGEWGEKESEVDAWHHRGHPAPHRGRMRDDYGHGMRIDLGRGEGNKRRMPRNEPEQTAKDTPTPSVNTAPPRQDPEIDDKPIPDDLSEISDDPDDILNRDDMVDQVLDEDSQTAVHNGECGSKPEGSEKESTQDMSGAVEEKDSHEAKDEDVTNLDFEEISDGELEEERTRAGLGDALGVDWASLVADVRRREQSSMPSGGARDRWRPERVLSRLGLSVNMAGKEVVQDILQKNAESIHVEKNKQNETDQNGSAEQNGTSEKERNLNSPPDVNSIHPVASIQVAIEKRKRQRAILFGTGCEITRGLSARRDLALRRYLCSLPTAERTGHSRVTPQTSLFDAARSLLLPAPATG